MPQTFAGNILTAENLETARVLTGGFTIEPFEANEIEKRNEDLVKIKPVLKKRHLNQDERRALNNPNSDWIQTQSGEVCKSACTLVVDDLVEKDS